MIRLTTVDYPLAQPTPPDEAPYALVVDLKRFPKDWWWVAVSLVFAVVLGLLLGYLVAFVVYAVLNGLGVWTFLPSSRSSPTRADTTVRALAAVLIPVGFLMLFPKGPGREIAPGEGVPPTGGAPGGGGIL